MSINKLGLQSSMNNLARWPGLLSIWSVKFTLNDVNLILSSLSPVPGRATIGCIITLRIICCPLALVLLDLLYTLYCTTSMLQHRVHPQLCLIYLIQISLVCAFFWRIYSGLPWNINCLGRFPVPWKIYHSIWMNYPQSAAVETPLPRYYEASSDQVLYFDYLNS